MVNQICEETVIPIDEILPPIGEKVIVECEGFRCVGICDRAGSWRSAYDDQVLVGVRGFRRFGLKRN
ncbi:MAG TPA: hypothetical protein VFV81_10245 [Verrucomicrobiae bacterium]|nr:hypothetical protein [Verrucomicrobiae bacterium]